MTAAVRHCERLAMRGANWSPLTIAVQRDLPLHDELGEPWTDDNGETRYTLRREGLIPALIKAGLLERSAWEAYLRIG